MEIIFKISEKKSFLLAFSMLFFTLHAKAEDSNNILNQISIKSYSGFFIIGGVFGFGLITFLISKIASRYYKKDENKCIRRISRRQKNYYKVIRNHHNSI